MLTNRWNQLLFAFCTICLLAAALGCADPMLTPGVDDRDREDWEGVLEEGPPLGGFDSLGKADTFGLDLPTSAPLPRWADLDAPLTALFAPDDPTVTLEIEMIARVQGARQADPSHYEEGDNPYRIWYAVYNLRNPRITEALADAHHAGVDVQVLIDAKQLSPELDYNVMDEYLVGRGFELAQDHRALDTEGRRTADLVGIACSGLMHLKTRLFETPTWSAVLSGSQNPGDNAVMNEETLHLINDPTLVAAYARTYEAVLTGGEIVNRWDPQAAVNLLFTPAASGDRAVTHLMRWIDEEEEQILLMVFSLRNLTAPGFSESLVELLGRKVREGVPVYVITDRKQSDGVDATGARVGWEDKTEDQLRAVGVHVYEAINARTPFTAMHHKVAILGRTHLRVITDASNWTAAGMGNRTRRASNFESVLFIDSQRLDGGRTGRRYLAQWLRVLERYADQSAREGEPSYAEVFGRLSGADDWPAMPVLFVADRAHTDWGEEIRVCGDLDELGAWGQSGACISLVTDDIHYPEWFSELPVDLPLGARFQWKLVRARPGDPGVLAWEGGPNRWSDSRPLALHPDDILEINGTWR
ncbi:MAG: hypothetical protein JW797_20295 [Bradymonadales bacterium]|nr:hypothetical protein [Bradymonadales bacterium]